MFCTDPTPTLTHKPHIDFIVFSGLLFSTCMLSSISGMLCHIFCIYILTIKQSGFNEIMKQVPIESNWEVLHLCIQATISCVICRCVVLCLVLHLGGGCLVLHLGHHKLCHLANSCRTLELILPVTMFVCLFTQIYVLYCQVALSLPSNR